MTPMFNAVSFIFLLQLARCTTTCPKQCRCKETDIFCHERKLKAVPHPIPSDYIKLYLQANDLGISELRMGLHEHKQLQVLDLANNKLREFPLELPECLHNLKLQNNGIRVISRSALSQLPCLKELHLEYNSLSEGTIELGAFKQLTSLTMLFLSNNNFSAVPSELPLSLTLLNMERNHIDSLSEYSFTNLTNLKKLFLDGNSLNNAGIHVQAFSDLKNLQIISLKENRFTTPPAHLPGNSLQKIYLNENNITAILPNTLNHMKNLNELILSENKLSNLAFEAFDGVDKLKTLILWNNPWICDCRLLWLKKRMLKNSGITIGLKCGTPASLRNKYLKNIGAKELCSMTTTPLPPPTTTTITTNITETFSTDDPSVFVMETTAMSTLASTVMMTHLSTLSGDLKVVIQSYARKNTIVVQWNNTKADAMYKLHWQKIGDVEEGHCIINGSEKEVELKVLEPSEHYNISLERLTKKAAKFSVCVDDVRECVNQQNDLSCNNTIGKLPSFVAGVLGGCIALVVLITLIVTFCCVTRISQTYVVTPWNSQKGRRKGYRHRASIMRVPHKRPKAGRHLHEVQLSSATVQQRSNPAT